MSEINISGIPNLGIPGLSGFNNQQSFINPGAGLANAQAQYAQNQRYQQNQAATLGTANAISNQATSNLTQDPAIYAAIGAAYGRNTGGFRGAAAPPAGSSVFETGAGPVPYLDSPPPGSFSPSPNYPGGRAVASPPSPPSYSAGDPFQTASPGGNVGGGNVGAFFPTSGYQDPFNTPASSGGFAQANARGIPQVPAPTPQPEFSPNQGEFGGLFSGLRSGLGSPAPDVSSTPSPETVYQGFPQFTEGGSTRASQNTGSANPFTSGAAPITNLNGPSQAGRGFEPTPPSVFKTGAPHIGPTMGPNMAATPSGVVGRMAAPRDFAPSSPFEGGTSPVPFQSAGGQAFPAPGIGGYRGGLRDQVAAIVGGSNPTQNMPLQPSTMPGAGPSEPTPSPGLGGVVPGRNVGGANPFTSGADPFKFAGDYRGSLRDQIAQAITAPPGQGPTVQPIGPVPMPQPRPPAAPTPTPSPSPISTPTPTQPQMNNAMDMIRSGRGWTVGATPMPAPQSPYAPINQAISDIGSVSRPGMFDRYTLPPAPSSQPMGSMFSPGRYR